MIRAIAVVAGGEAIFGAGVATRALNYFSTPRATPRCFPNSHLVTGGADADRERVG